MTNNICDSFHEEFGKEVCYGTKEREECKCKGDRAKCDFYPNETKQEDNKWILVTDRVPEDDRLVIVCTESGQVYTDYYFDDKPDFWRLAKIIAWQDLPSAYKKEDSE